MENDGELESHGAPNAFHDLEAVVQAAFVHWPLSEQLEGPPGHCHGGGLAALMDDAPPGT